MWPLVLSLVAAGVLQPNPEGLPAAPFDVAVGHQIVELRAPLVARAPGVRLVLFVQSPATAGFESAVPAGSVTAHLTSRDGRELTLAHTAYAHYRGFTGLVLTEVAPAERAEFFAHLELDAKVSLQNVRLVWLDRLGRQVQDVRPVL